MPSITHSQWLLLLYHTKCASFIDKRKPEKEKKLMSNVFSLHPEAESFLQIIFRLKRGFVTRSSFHLILLLLVEGMALEDRF